MSEASARSCRIVESKTYALKNDHVWAICTVSSVAPTFHLLQVASDYGNWSYVWAAPGGTFRQFLIGLARDTSYLVAKLTSDHASRLGASQRTRKSDEEACRRFVDELYVPALVPALEAEEANSSQEVVK